MSTYFNDFKANFVLVKNWVFSKNVTKKYMFYASSEIDFEFENQNSYLKM